MFQIIMTIRPVKRNGEAVKNGREIIARAAAAENKSERLGNLLEPLLN